MATIKLPAALVGGSATSKVEIAGETVAELFDNHAAEHGDELRDSVIEDGEIKEFINVYVDGTPVDGLDAEVPDDAQVRVIPAASGGR
ncbi:MoaD/ThiS family protein [Halorubrum ezzemoulense]|jgi:molybdopterin synthase sulfur carrier subunit|uniref:MoaD/ThiS family protein n=1 Tax=Halorubrum ezzemoulense TaxID=337243 RepID=UPI002330B778|nr:MoaD/ThiS family protein [Halorubrum ezzemoulense]MDB2240291.1 MoaD/ThiS family protein [Halorubrum ezzemoulense]